MRKTLVTDDEVARIAWDTYSKAVGGKAFNGDPLPTWDVMCKDEKKENLVVAWKRCARAVATHVEKKLPAVAAAATADTREELQVLLERMKLAGSFESAEVADSILKLLTPQAFKVVGASSGRMSTAGGPNLSSPGVAHSSLPAPIRTLAVRTKCCGSMTLSLQTGAYACPCGDHKEPI
jgi:hypothetical protein